MQVTVVKYNKGNNLTQSSYSATTISNVSIRSPGNRVLQRQRSNYDEEWTLWTESSWDTALIQPVKIKNGLYTNEP